MSTCVDKFKVNTEEEQANLLAQKLPDGDFWIGKNDESTNLRKLLIALGLELIRTEIALNKYYCETQLYSTNELIDEWETQYGIKGGCFDGYGTTLEERIEAIRLKISTFGTSTKEQFEAIGAALGLDIKVYAGWDYATFPFNFPIYFFENSKWAKFTMVVDLENVPSSTFTLTFDFPFGDPAVSVLKCLFNKLRPANVRILYFNE